MLIRQTMSAWYTHHPSRLAASIAYYTVMSFVPMLVLSLLLASLLVGADAARGQLAAELGSLVGPSVTNLLQGILAEGHQAHTGLAGGLAIVVLLIGASGVWSEVSNALNLIWDARPAASDWKALVRQQLAGISMVVVVVALLLLLVLMSAVAAFLSGIRPVPPGVLEAINLIAPFLVLTLLFASIYRVLPATPIPWSDVWIGAAVTSALFTLGKMAIGFYLGRYASTSTYGPAGGLLAALLFVYYSAHIFLFGAEFTHVFAHRHGSRAAEALVEPTAGNAMAQAPSPQPDVENSTAVKDSH